MAFIVVPLIIGIALSLLAAVLTPKPKQPTPTTYGPNSTTARGSVIPLVIGCRRVGANLAWVGHRTTKTEKAAGGKGLGGGGGSGQKIFYEQGWHQLCVGPCYSLRKIVQNGKIIYDQQITRINTPSGSQITMLNGEGTATIYWGEINQPIDTTLASRTGVSSRWPFVCYLFWTKKKLGSSPVWPNLEYEVDVRPPYGSFFIDVWDSNFGLLTDGTYYLPFAAYDVGTDPVFTYYNYGKWFGQLDGLSGPSIHFGSSEGPIFPGPLNHGYGMQIGLKSFDNDTIIMSGSRYVVENGPPFVWSRTTVQFGDTNFQTGGSTDWYRYREVTIQTYDNARGHEVQVTFVDEENGVNTQVIQKLSIVPNAPTFETLTYSIKMTPAQVTVDVTSDMTGAATQVVIPTPVGADYSKARVSGKYGALVWILPNGGPFDFITREYDLSVQVQAVTFQRFLTSSASYMYPTTGNDNDGINPAHALWQLLTGTFPQGIGIDTTELDTQQFEYMGQIFESEGTPCNLVATDGKATSDVISSMMQDFGFVFAQIKAQISPVVIRDTNLYGTDVTVDAQTLAASTVIQRSQNYDDNVADRIVFLFASRLNNFRDMDVQVDDDSISEQRNSQAFKQIRLDNVIDTVTANRIARRRILEFFTDPEVYSITVMKGARRLYPGQRFILDQVGTMRVASVQWDEERPETVLECALDQYATAAGTYTPDDTGIGGGGSIVPIIANADLAVLAMQLPTGTVSGKISIGVIRIRYSSDIVSADVYASLSPSGPYVLLGTQAQWGEGGTLTDNMLAVAGLLNPGPHFDELNTDTGDALDLTDDPGFASGRQIMVVGDEIMYVESLTAMGGPSWLTNNVLRGQNGSTVALHSIGDTVFIQEIGALVPFTSDLFSPGQTIYIKTVPATSGHTMDITQVNPVSITLAGSPVPIAPNNFRANDGIRVNEYSTGQDIVFDWDWSVRNAGINQSTPAGTAIDDTTLVIDGFFRIRIFNHVGGTLVDTRDISDNSGTFTLTNADLRSDFTALVPLAPHEPATFYATITSVTPDGFTESTPTAITITKV